jgi:hypothetical protein
MAGHEHRDYIIGDSLKKVNWKLSAKRQKLMIRQDEAINPSKITFVLAGNKATIIPPQKTTLFGRQLDYSDENKEEYKRVEKQLENLLLMLKLFSANSIPCKIMYVKNRIVYTEEVTSRSGSIEELGTELAGCGYYPDYKLLATEITAQKGVYIIDGLSNDFYNTISVLEKNCTWQPLKNHCDKMQVCLPCSALIIE